MALSARKAGLMRKLIVVAVVAASSINLTTAREVANEVHTAVSCAVTSTLALASNVKRTSALLVNDSAAVIYIKIGEAAVLNEGIRLNANGGSYYISDTDGNLDREAINCIVASGTGTILITEWST